MMKKQYSTPKVSVGTVKIALGKTWKRGIEDETVKPLDEIQRVQVPSGQSRAGRPEASVAIHWVTGGCEAYTARKQAVKIQLRNRTSLRCRRSSSGGRQNSERPRLRGRAGVAGVSSSGHASTGIFQGPRRAPHLLLTKGGTDGQGRPEAPGRMLSSLTSPYVPRKVGNRRAPARGGHGTHWREGANKRTCLLKET
jgi:hypothetical protein